MRVGCFQADTARGQLSRLSWANVQLCRPASVPLQSMAPQGGVLEAMGEVMAPKSPSALEATGAHSSGISSSNGDAATRRTTLSGEERKPDATVLSMYADFGVVDTVFPCGTFGILALSCAPAC